MDDDLYDSIVHGLRSRGWSREDAEDEALTRIERARHQDLPPLTCGGVGVNYTVRAGRIVFQ